MRKPVPTITTGLGKLESGKGHIGFREQAVNPPGPGEALLEVIGSGVCGTDLHIADDEFAYEAPVTMGHEVTGYVEGVGSEADSSWLGKRVACETYYSNCEMCSYCLSGRPNLCDQRRSIGSRVDGGFAAWMTIPVRNLWELPADVGLYAGALTEPLACVTNCLLDPTIISPGDDVLVIGPGTMGILTAQVARACGAHVTVVGLSSDVVRLDLAESLGFEVFVSPEGTKLPTRSFDVVCECSGTESGAEFGLRHVMRGGHYVQVGIFGHPVRLTFDMVLYRELTVSSGNASTPKSWQRAVSLLGDGSVQLDPLLTEVVRLAEWERVFDAVRAGDGVKYVLSPKES